MEENPPRVSRKEGIQGAGKGGGGPTRRNRYAVAVDDSGDFIECSGKYCRSCTTGLVADCVALCCCPCAGGEYLGAGFCEDSVHGGEEVFGVGEKEEKMQESGRFIIMWVCGGEKLWGFEQGQVRD
ncbi:hypothetical protein Pint_02728 [Pistacia integerrima]|uniref:Uncharacterized protein n=1 Tax=Pistacia integerrima TaxID=434235 RepID=A0ACC0ZHU5_9ROSI|nr:hypothetical protein Pint_02728 [Pistacia integerrima]